jgi:acetyl-CoA carboxylase biotin carboxyl carrier protein
MPAHLTGIPSVGLDPSLLASPASSASDTASESSSSQSFDDDLLTITSPIVGTFYEAPSPDSNPYVEVGTPVSSSTVVCIIEAMKVMNEIKADVSGTVAQVLVSNGQAVEFGQALFKVKPN